MIEIEMMPMICELWIELECLFYSVKVHFIVKVTGIFIYLFCLVQPILINLNKMTPCETGWVGHLEYVLAWSNVLIKADTPTYLSPILAGKLGKICDVDGAVWWDTLRKWHNQLLQLVEEVSTSLYLVE